LSKEGGSLELLCTVDGYYEWCTFKHPDGRICDFEWSRNLWDVAVLQCGDFTGRMTRIGDFINAFIIFLPYASVVVVNNCLPVEVKTSPPQ
jgi:hypothetical protein